MISSGHYKVLLKLKEYHDICIGAESLRLWSYEVEIPKWTIETEKKHCKAYHSDITNLFTMQILIQLVLGKWKCGDFYPIWLHKLNYWKL